MSETAQQYIARIIGTLGGQDPWTVMAATPDRLRLLVAGASPGVLQWKSAPDRWSITEIAAHLADAEIVGAWRFRTVLAEDGVTLQAYDQNAWAAAFRYARAPIDESVALFGALRRATLRLLREVEPSRYEHAGMHAERGRESIAQIARMYAGHDLNHLAQIERLIEEAKK